MTSGHLARTQACNKFRFAFSTFQIRANDGQQAAWTLSYDFLLTFFATEFKFVYSPLFCKDMDSTATLNTISRTEPAGEASQLRPWCATWNNYLAIQPTCKSSQMFDVAHASMYDRASLIFFFNL